MRSTRHRHGRHARWITAAHLLPQQVAQRHIRGVLAGAGLHDAEVIAGQGRAVGEGALRGRARYHPVALGREDGERARATALAGRLRADDVAQDAHDLTTRALTNSQKTTED